MTDDGRERAGPPAPALDGTCEADALDAGVAKDGSEIQTLLRLMGVDGIGAITVRRLLEACGSVRKAELAVLSRRTRRTADLARALSDPARAAAARRQAGVLEHLGGRVLTILGRAYPDALRRLTHPPAALFLRGRVEVLDAPCVAVVGTRRATTYGLDATRLLVDGLARAGVTIVSGLARGIDGAAHTAALEAGGATVAVLGTGLDVAYPRMHTRLQEEIARTGLLITELPPGAGPRAHQFPIRNRIIAGLADAVVVVEAGLKSGTRGTVDYALGLGLDVYTVPGPIGRPQSEGTNALLLEGAIPAMCARDILDGLGVRPARSGSVRTSGVDGVADEEHTREAGRTGGQPAGGVGRAALSANDARLLDALEHDPLPVEDLAARANLAVSDALVTLLALEMAGHARRLPGARFARSAIPAGRPG